MQNAKREVTIRDVEVNSVIDFLKNAETNGQIGVTVKTSIKASVILMLYNAVESTMTTCLERLHEILIRQNLMFDNCNDNLKQLVAVYYENAKEKSSDIHNRAPHILSFYEYVKNSRSFDLSYMELSKYYSLYSGNLDSRSIISVLNKYGIDFDEKATELKTIKDARNKLAHGEQSFEEIGRDLSIQQLQHMKEQAFEYLIKIINVIEDYIEGEHFKPPNLTTDNVNSDC
jgi:hypothetical protein